MLLPLITAPYISRKLGANLAGVYSKTHAAANYFYLFTLLGVNNYGNRAIARIRDDKEVRSKTFWEIYIFQFIISIFVFASYVLFCVFFESENKLIYILQGFYVFSGIIEINWFCYGMEQFKLTTIRSTVVRLLNLACVFIFVHDKSDLPVYTAILSVSFVLSAIVVWPYALKNVRFVKPDWAGIKQHIKPNLVLFWPVLAVSLYNIMDKLLLGHFSPNEEVGFYTYAERIVTIPATLILALDNVVMPRMSSIFAKKDTEHAQVLMGHVMMFAMCMAGAMTFGLAGVSKVFAPWFYGEEYVRCGLYMLLLSPTVLFKGWAGALRTQYIIPTGKDKIFIFSLTAGAAVNLILDFLLIPTMQGVGAIIGTIAAEVTVAVLQFGLCRKAIPLKTYLINGTAFTVIGLMMFFCVKAVELLQLSPLPTLILQVATGMIVYCVLACFYMVKVIRQPVLVNEALKMLRIRYRF